MSFSKFVTPCALIFVASILPQSAIASSVVLGDSKAAECSRATFGAKFTPGFEQLCTEAMEEVNITTYDLAATHVNRGIIRLRMGRKEAANTDFNRAIELSPKLGEAYVNRGSVAILQSRFDDGIADINQGLEFGLDEPAKAYFNRALAYEALDNLKSAYYDFKRANELKPEWEEPKTQLLRFSVTRK